MDMPSVIEGGENGIASHVGKESKFEPDPALNVGVQIQNLVKVRYHNLCNFMKYFKSIQIQDQNLL